MRVTLILLQMNFQSHSSGKEAAGIRDNDKHGFLKCWKSILT